MASPLFSSLEEAGADQGAERQQPRAANAVDVGDEGVDDLLAGLRAKEASRNARRRASPAAAGRDREATALRRTRQIARPAEPSAALASISQNTERLQTQAAKFSLHEATKEMLEAERAEWRSEVAALKHSLKLREAEVGELRRDLRLLERTCADQAEAKERDHAALTTRVAQLELTIELWVAEMSTGAKTKQRPSLPGSARAGSTEASPAGPSPATRAKSLDQLKATADPFGGEDMAAGAVFRTVAPPSFLAEADGADAEQADGADDGVVDAPSEGAGAGAEG